MEFRVGGVWHYCLRGPNPGDESWGRAVFEEIVEPERIVYTDSFSDRHGNVNEGMPETRSTVEFSDLGDRTEVAIRARYPTADALQQVLDRGMIKGLTETLDRLEAYVEGGLSPRLSPDSARLPVRNFSATFDGPATVFERQLQLPDRDARHPGYHPSRRVVHLGSAVVVRLGPSEKQRTVASRAADLESCILAEIRH